MANPISSLRVAGDLAIRRNPEGKAVSASQGPEIPQPLTIEAADKGVRRSVARDLRIAGHAAVIIHRVGVAVCATERPEITQPAAVGVAEERVKGDVLSQMSRTRHTSARVDGIGQAIGPTQCPEAPRWRGSAREKGVLLLIVREKRGSCYLSALVNRRGVTAGAAQGSKVKNRVKVLPGKVGRRQHQEDGDE